MIGLPSLEALDQSAATRCGGEACRIWLAPQPADVSCGFDRRKDPLVFAPGKREQIAVVRSK